LLKAIEFAKKYNFKKIYAGTIPENTTASKFYLENGFIQSKSVPKGITAAENSICFELNL